MNFIRFLFSKQLWLNILAMLVVSLLLFGLTFQGLSNYTHHGEKITVPDLRNMSLDEIEVHLKSKSLRYTVLDSTYVKGKAPKTVIEQNPGPAEKVKENRRIYLTINAQTPPIVKVPNIIDASLRNAEAQLQSVGLEIGEKEYKPDIAKNAVLEMKYENKTVEAGTGIPKGSTIDLVLGSGISNTRIDVPELIGKTFHEAKITLKLLDLHVGSVVMDGEITDVPNALVHWQAPPPSIPGTTRLINIGEPIDLFLKENPNAPAPQDSSIRSAADSTVTPIPVDTAKVDTTNPLGGPPPE